MYTGRLTALAPRLLLTALFSLLSTGYRVNHIMGATLTDLGLPLLRTGYYCSLNQGYVKALKEKIFPPGKESALPLVLDGDQRFQASQNTEVNPAGPVGHLTKESSRQEGRFALKHAKDMGGINISS